MSDRWSTETAAVKYHKTIFQNSDSWWWLNMILFAIMSTFVKCDSKGPKRRNKKSSQNWWAKFNEGTNKYTKSRLGSRAKCTQAIWQRQKVYYERPSLDFSWTSFLLVISKFIPVWLLFKSLLTTVITPQLQRCPVSKYLLILKLWNDFCVMRTGFSATPVQFLTDLHLSISTFHSWRKCTRVVVSSVACSSFFFSIFTALCTVRSSLRVLQRISSVVSWSNWGRTFMVHTKMPLCTSSLRTPVWTHWGGSSKLQMQK